MILPLVVAAGEHEPRRTWAVWLLALASVIPAGLEFAANSGWLPAHFMRLAWNLGAAIRLHSEPGMLAPWQPWSSTLAAIGPLDWLIATWALLVPVRVLEQRVGGAVVLVLAAVLAPLAALPAILAGVPEAQPGPLPLVAGLSLAAVLLTRGAHLEPGVAWWAVAWAGWRPLGRLPLWIAPAVLAGLGIVLGIHWLILGAPLVAAPFLAWAVRR